VVPIQYRPVAVPGADSLGHNPHFVYLRWFLSPLCASRVRSSGEDIGLDACRLQCRRLLNTCNPDGFLNKWKVPRSEISFRGTCNRACQPCPIEGALLPNCDSHCTRTTSPAGPSTHICNFPTHLPQQQTELRGAVEARRAHIGKNSRPNQ
jgi:hypothetical protein